VDWSFGDSNRNMALGTSVNMGGTLILARGTYTQLHSGLPYSTNLMEITLSQSGAHFSSSILVDVAFGAPGSEQVIVPNLNAGIEGFDYKCHKYLLPFHVPQGIPIAARAAINDSGNIALTAVNIQISAFSGGFLTPPEMGNNFRTYGDLSTFSGTSIVASTQYIWSAWTQITSATTLPHKLLWVNMHAPQTSLNLYFLEIAIGGAGSEQLLLGPIPWPYGANSPANSTQGPFPVNIPQGMRLSARIMSPESFNPSRQVTLLLHGA
jgi:hypothetical protein